MRLPYSRVSVRRFRRRVKPTSLQRAIPSARTSFATPSPLLLGQTGLRNIDRMSIPCPYPDGVRSRLTLNRLALFRNPWSFGEGFPAPLSLLIPAFAFPPPPACLAARLLRRRNAPLPICHPTESTSSAPDLCPIIIHAVLLD